MSPTYKSGPGKQFIYNKTLTDFRQYSVLPRRRDRFRTTVKFDSDSVHFSRSQKPQKTDSDKTNEQDTPSLIRKISKTSKEASPVKKPGSNAHRSSFHSNVSKNVVNGLWGILKVPKSKTEYTPDCSPNQSFARMDQVILSEKETKIPGEDHKKNKTLFPGNKVQNMWNKLSVTKFLSRKAINKQEDAAILTHKSVLQNLGASQIDGQKKDLQPSGKVSTIAKMIINHNESQLPVIKSKVDTKTSTKAQVKTLEDEEDPIEEKDPLLCLILGGVLYGVLSTGAILGEMALENDAPRIASGISSEDTELLVITKKDYNELFSEIMQEERKLKMNLVNNVIPEVLCYSKKAQTSVVYTMKEIKFHKGDIIFQEGQKIDKVLIIVDGICGIKKKLDTEHLAQVQIDSMKAKTEADIQQTNHITNHLKLRIDLSESKVLKNIKVCNCGKGEIIGDEFFQENKNCNLPLFQSISQTHDGNEHFLIGELFNAKQLRFTFYAETSLTCYMISKSDQNSFIQNMQPRIKKEYKTKNQERNEIYIKSAIQYITRSRGGADNDDLIKVDELKTNLNVASLYKIYGKCLVKNLQQAVMTEKEELGNIKTLLKSNMNRKDEIKKRKSIIEKEVLTRENHIFNSKNSTRLASSRDIVANSNNSQIFGKKLKSIVGLNLDKQRVSIDVGIKDKIGGLCNEIGMAADENMQKAEGGSQSEGRAGFPERQLKKNATIIEDFNESNIFDSKDNLCGGMDSKIDKVKQSSFNTHRHENMDGSPLLTQDITNLDVMTPNTDVQNINISDFKKSKKYDILTDRRRSERSPSYLNNLSPTTGYGQIMNSDETRGTTQLNQTLYQAIFGDRKSCNKAKDSSIIQNNNFHQTDRIGRRPSEVIDPINLKKWLRISKYSSNTNCLTHNNILNNKRESMSAMSECHPNIVNKRSLEIEKEGTVYRKLKGDKVRHDTREKTRIINHPTLRHTLPIKRQNNLVHGINLKKNTVMMNLDHTDRSYQESTFRVMPVSRKDEIYVRIFCLLKIQSLANDSSPESFMRHTDRVRDTRNMVRTRDSGNDLNKRVLKMDHLSFLKGKNEFGNRKTSSDSVNHTDYNSGYKDYSNRVDDINCDNGQVNGSDLKRNVIRGLKIKGSFGRINDEVREFLNC